MEFREKNGYFDIYVIYLFMPPSLAGWGPLGPLLEILAQQDLGATRGVPDGAWETEQW